MKRRKYFKIISKVFEKISNANEKFKCKCKYFSKVFKCICIWPHLWLMLRSFVILKFSNLKQSHSDLTQKIQVWDKTLGFEGISDLRPFVNPSPVILVSERRGIWTFSTFQVPDLYPVGDNFEYTMDLVLKEQPLNKWSHLKNNCQGLRHGQLQSLVMG